jgi:hypothetical protein
MKPKGRPHTAADRARISRGVLRELEVRRARESVAPADIRALLKPGGAVLPEMRPLLDLAAIEKEALSTGLGGVECMSPQRLALLDDFVRVGVVLRAALARFAQTADPECASRVGTLASVRRASLVAIGLDEHRVEHDLGEYLAAKRTNGAGTVTLDADQAGSETPQTPAGGDEAADVTSDGAPVANASAEGSAALEADQLEREGADT